MALLLSGNKISGAAFMRANMGSNAARLITAWSQLPHRDQLWNSEWDLFIKREIGEVSL